MVMSQHKKKKFLFVNLSGQDGNDLYPISIMTKLEKKGHDVRFAVLSNRMYESWMNGNSKWKKRLYRNRMSSYPGFPDELRSNSDLIHFETAWIESWVRMRDLVKWADILEEEAVKNG